MVCMIFGTLNEHNFIFDILWNKVAPSGEWDLHKHVTD